MFNDVYDNNVGMEGTAKVSMSAEQDAMEERTDEKKHWKVTDVIRHADGTEEVREYHNTVVDECSRLIASMMKNHNGYGGISYWAVGSGVETWDDSNPPAPSVGDTVLSNETFRKAVLAEHMEYLDEADQPTPSITNKMRIQMTFTEDEANGPLREFGLYGGNATGTKDSGIMINRKNHGLIYKTSGMTLERTIILTF